MRQLSWLKKYKKLRITNFSFVVLTFRVGIMIKIGKFQKINYPSDLLFFSPKYSVVFKFTKSKIGFF